MCNHLRVKYPEDIPENYNKDGETITGICRGCGKRRKAYGMRWAIQIEEKFLRNEPYGETIFDYLDKRVEIW